LVQVCLVGFLDDVLRFEWLSNWRLHCIEEGEGQKRKGAITLDRMLVVVFESESKAYEGKKALLQLDSEGSISVYGYAVVAKNANGTATVKQGDDAGPLGTLVGTSLGSLIGALFGPAGLAIGATAGFAGGATADLTNAGVGEDFIDDVSKFLLPTKVAVVAEIEEDWTTPVDNGMESIGGLVFRRALSDVRHQVHQENVASMKADMAQFKAEHAQAHADRKAKLKEKINQLDSKIQAQLQAAKERRQAAEREIQAQLQVAKERRQAAEREAQAKAQILKSKASSAAAAAR
jgi:uncharacterized membrane protein